MVILPRLVAATVATPLLTLEMTRQEIRELLHARAAPNDSCTSINSLIDEHITHVQTRVAELKALEQQLIQLRRQCQAAHTNRDCGILRSLDHSVADGLDYVATWNAAMLLSDDTREAITAAMQKRQPRFQD